MILRVLELSWPSILRYAAATGYKKYDSIVTHSYGVACCSKAVSAKRCQAIPCRHGSAGPSMSCLRHVSKRSKGNVANDFGVVKDSVQQVPIVPLLVSVPLDDTSVKVWSVSDFTILHELQKPVVVVSAGTYEVSHR